MQEKIAVKAKQVIPLLLIFSLPAVFSIMMRPITEDEIPRDFANVFEWVVVGLSMIIGCAISFFMWTRGSIKIHNDQLVIEHGFYTFTARKNEFLNCKMRKVLNYSALQILLKKNGIAGFGYYSGHFITQGDQRMFCAVSDRPIYVLELKENEKFRYLAISCSENMASGILNWAKTD